MVASRIAKRKTTKRAPRLVDAGDRRRIEFSPDGISYISGLLGIGTRLPVTYWDSARSGYVAEIDATEKSGLLLTIHEAALGLTQTVRLMGLLMAGEEKGYLEGNAVPDLGFCLNGLADLTEQLLRVEEELACAEPIGANAAEPEVAHA